METNQMNTAQIEILNREIRKLQSSIEFLNMFKKVAEAFGADAFDVEEKGDPKIVTLHIRNARMSKMSTEDLWGTHPERMIRLYPVAKVVVHWSEKDGPNYAMAIEHFGPGCYAIRNGTVAYDKRVSHEMVGSKKESYAPYCFRVEVGKDLILAGE